MNKGTFFRTIESSYRFILTNQKLEKSEAVVVDEAKAKLSKKELKHNEIVTFSFNQIKRVYAAQMGLGKVSLVVAEDESGLNVKTTKVFTVMIHDAEPEQLKRFCSTIESLINDRKLQLEEREKKGDE